MGAGRGHVPLARRLALSSCACDASWQCATLRGSAAHCRLVAPSQPLCPHTGPQVSFGSILSPLGIGLMVYGFGAFFNLLPGGDVSSLLLIYGFPITVSALPLLRFLLLFVDALLMPLLMQGPLPAAWHCRLVLAARHACCGSCRLPLLNTLPATHTPVSCSCWALR